MPVKRAKAAKVSDLPKITIPIDPEVKVLLDALAALDGVAAWKVIESAIRQRVERLPADERAAIELISRKAKNRA